MYCGYITTLHNLRKHSNADKLKCVEVFGQNVIVDLSYYEGQKVVFFPTDGQLSEEFANENNLVRKKDENGNNIGGYMDESKRNITAIKLRGEKSEGLVLPIEVLSKYTDISKLKDGDQITVLGGHEICKKYIPKSNYSQQRSGNSNGKQNKKYQKETISYPYFDEHIDTSQLDYNLNAFKEGDIVYLTRKLHGCFARNTRIRLWGKKEAVKIQDIKIGDIVVGYKDGKFIPSKVEKTFINGKTREWQKIKFSRQHLSGGEKYGTIKCTPDHLFWDYKINDYKKAKDLKVGEKIGLIKEDWILDNTAKSILLGMYLGDSHYDIQESRHHGVSATLQFSAKKEYIEYLEYIYNTLKGFIILDENEYMSGYGTTMKRGHTRYSIDLRNYFDSILDLSDSENKLTEKIIDYFTIESLVFLYCDDGSLSHSDFQRDRAALHVCDYNEHDVKIIIKCLNKLGLNNVTYFTDQRGYYRISVNADSAEIMFNMIKDYIPNVMKYKLPENLRQSSVNIIHTNIVQGYSQLTTQILENVSDNKVFGVAANKYDLQTETSNYVVGNLLVHNSSQRCSNAIEITKKKRPFILKKVFKLKDKEIKQFKLVSGTRRTILKDYDGGYYGSNAFRKQWHDFFVDKLPKGMTVYFEVVGWVNESTPIMGRCNNKLVKDKEFQKMYGKETVFTYGCEPGECDMYVYRMTMTNDDGVVIELPTEEVKMWCERLGCKFVPILDKFMFTTVEDLNERVNKWLDLPDEIDPRHISEGVVARIDNRSKFTAYKRKGFNFKVLEGIIKDNSDAPDIEEAEELIVAETN